MPPISGPFPDVESYLYYILYGTHPEIKGEEVKVAVKQRSSQQGIGLSYAGQTVLRHVYRQLRASLNESGYMPRRIRLAQSESGLHPSTYARGLKELLEKQHIYRVETLFSRHGSYEGIFAIDKNKLYETPMCLNPLQSNPSVRYRPDYFPPIKFTKDAYEEPPAGAVGILAVSLPWLAFAVFHSPFLTAFFAITTFISGAALVDYYQPQKIQEAKRKLKEVFKKASNKIKGTATGQKSRSKTIQTQPNPIGFESPTQREEVQNSLPLLSKDFRTVADDTQNEVLPPNYRSELTAAKRKGFNL